MSERAFILGGGRFGTHLAARLCEFGWEIVIADRDTRRVKNLSEDGFHAVELDIEDPDDLREAGVAEADVVVVALGESMQTTILATLTLKDLKVKRVVARAVDDTESRVLEKIGADLVVMPIRDSAHRLAERLRSEVLSDRVPIGRDYQFAQVRIGAVLHGHTLADAKVRDRFRVNVVLVTRNTGKPHPEEIEPGPGLELQAGDLVGVVGRHPAIERFEQECGEAAPSA
jgi:trk system potassium uptake protein TrkA